MKISKIYLRICSLLFVCFLVCGSILRPVVTYASPYDLMINTDSNALMTLDLDDSDYLMMSPRSSIGTVSNTISGPVDVIAWFQNDSGVITSRSVKVSPVNGHYDFKILDHDLPSGYYLYLWEIWMTDKNLPSIGSYDLSFAFSSDFTIVDYNAFGITSIKNNVNASSQSKYLDLTEHLDQAGGDLYFAPYSINLTNIDRMVWGLGLPLEHHYRNVAGSFEVNFTKIESGNYPSTAGSNPSNEDYQSDVSSSLSDLSSSVGSMTEDLSSAAENLEYISTSQNLIIQGIDNVVMHISDQLFAFWNQLYNLIHVPTMAKMDDIISAIQNMDIEFEVNLDGLKATINNMSTAIQSKLQSVADTITGGYDNSSIDQNGNKLDSSITEFEEAEQNVLESVNDSLNDFEFDVDLSEYKNIVQVISDFLQELYDSSGGFKLVINLSLMLSVASIVIGVYRFKEGG